MPPINTPLAGSKFNLNSAGVAGFFGGEEAISAMASVHLFKGKRWLGWFNSPGSYTIARRFGRMANSHFWSGLFPGQSLPPAVSFGLDGKEGPTYIAALFEGTIPTGHLAALTMERCKEYTSQRIPGRMTRPVRVAYLAMKKVNPYTPIECLPFPFIALIPISVSVVTCVMCALVHDWFSFSMILLGIISNGLANQVICKGRLVIKPIIRRLPAGVPPAHGLLMGDGIVVVLKGAERDVNVITKGHFDLEKDTRIHDEEDGDGDGDGEYGTERSQHDIGLCSLLLLVQFFLQLLLVPQGSLFGQIMFLISLGVSWVYICYLSSLESSKAQTDMLFQALDGPEARQFQVGTRTTTAVFVCLLLFHKVEVPDNLERDPRERILCSYLPNDTAVWRLWRARVVEQLRNVDDRSLSCLVYNKHEGDLGLPVTQQKLLQVLLDDARSAFHGYLSVCDELPDDSSQEKV